MSVELIIDEQLRQSVILSDKNVQDLLAYVNLLIDKEKGLDLQNKINNERNDENE